MGQKGAETLIYQQAEPPQQVGKDEVPSSNLGSSSRENRSNLRIWAVFYALQIFRKGLRKYGESSSFCDGLKLEVSIYTHSYCLFKVLAFLYALR